MSLTAKALFTIERNLNQSLTLEAVATACDVSRFHLAHAFVTATGRTVMDYIRARRLTEAARALARGAPRILDLAIVAEYASHEAFSRAFRARFQITPEMLRERGSLNGLNLQEILTMPNSQAISLAAPSFRVLGEQLFVGLPTDRHLGEAAEIPAQWREFMSGMYPQISSKLEHPPVGVALPGGTDESFVYVCAAQVSRFGATPKDLIEVTVAPAEYAVFVHEHHVSALPQTYRFIWNEWFPSSGKAPKRAASLEHHHPSFDPRTGLGGITLWIPLA